MALTPLLSPLTATGAVGEFRFPRLWQGEVEIEARAGGGRSGVLRSDAAGALALELRDFPPPPRIAFTAPAPSPFPLWVSLMDTTGLTFLAQTDQDGVLLIEGMTEATYRIRVVGSPLVASPEWVDIGAETIVPLLPR